MVTILMVFGGLLMPLQVFAAKAVWKSGKTSHWTKYRFSYFLISAGLILALAGELAEGRYGAAAAGAGVTAIISVLIAIPAIALCLNRKTNQVKPSQDSGE